MAKTLVSHAEIECATGRRDVAD